MISVSDSSVTAASASTASASTAGAASSDDRQGFDRIATTATTAVAAPVTISKVFRKRCDGGGLIENDRARAAWRVDC